MAILSVFFAALLAATAIAEPIKRDTGEWVSIPALANWDSANLYDGTGAGVDRYTMYWGNGQTNNGWPAQSQWVSFYDMWNNNKPHIGQNCGQWGVPNNSGEETGDIWNAIQQVAQTTGVDHRFILAVVLQESGGCVRAPTSYWSVPNPGLMQDHDGQDWCNNGKGVVVNPCSQSVITGMISQGTAGTPSGDGLANCLCESAGWVKTNGDTADFYRAARIYNSGSIYNGNNLEQTQTGTACYSSDIANRLMGWVNASHGCSVTNI